MDKKLYKLILIEDNPGDALLIQEMLLDSNNKQFELKHANSLASGLERISSGGIDAILLDLCLPDGSGMEVYKKVRDQAGEIPIVALTGLQHTEFARELFRNGIQDYLIKGQFTSQILIHSLHRAIDYARDALKLRLSEARFRKLIETMTDTVVIVDTEGMVQFINPAGERLFRTTSAEFQGQSFGFPVMGDGSAEIELFGWKKEPVIAEMRVAETIWEEQPAWILSIRDITMNKKMTMSLEKFTKDLEQTVKQLESANKSILENQKSLLEEERLKVLLQMAGATAHELNQPLTVLLVNIELLQTLRENPEKQRVYVKEIEAAGKKIAEIVKKVQDIRKYESKPYVAGGSIIDLHQTIRILSVEDSDEDFNMIKTALADNRKIILKRARDFENARKIVQQENFDLVLLDYILPDGDCFSFCDFLQANKSDTPVIIITGQGDEVIASRLITEGAYDYIPKNRFSRAAITRSIGNTLDKVRLKREISRMHEKIKDMAIEDTLTGLYNRRFFQGMLDKEMARERRYKHNLIICMLDLDHFKEINDTYGHPIGDLVLAQVGNQIRQNFRENDIACRYGGDEFAVMLPYLNPKDAQMVGERMRNKVAGFEFKTQAGDFKISISIGMVECNCQIDKSPEDLMKRVDDALYQAKDQGRNKVVFVRA